MGHGDASYKIIPVLSQPLTDLNASFISAGMWHNIGIKSSSGELYSWGLNVNGQLGLRHNLEQNVPRLIKFFEDPGRFKQVSCHGLHSLALAENGKLYSWGNNDVFKYRSSSMDN